MEELHPGAKWNFRIGSFFVLLILLLILISQVSVIFFEKLSYSFFITVVVSVLIFSLIFSEIYSRMSFSRFRYEFGPSSLKIERGIIWKKYSNVPYERVQNVDISRGIIARMFGFSTVNIHTAGYSSGTKMGSEGSLPAVSIERAEKIREFLMGKISKGNQGHGM